MPSLFSFNQPTCTPIKHIAIVILALVLGLLVGFQLGSGPQESAYDYTVPRQGTPPDPDDATRETNLLPGQAPAPKESAIEELVSPGPRESANPTQALFSDPLILHAETLLAKTWTLERKDSIPRAQLQTGVMTFRTRTLELPTLIGAELAKAQTAKDSYESAIKNGDGHTLVKLMEEEGLGPFPELVGNADAFQGLCRRLVPSQVVEGTSISRDTREPVESGSTLTFPAGVFKLSNFPQSWSEGKGYGRDITISGKGMDHTLIILEQNLYTRIALQNMTFVDCTLFTNNNYLFDLRREPASITLNRTRVCGFDMGAGASCAFGTAELILLARDSIIMGGYGRHPQYGSVFDVRTNGLMARFENCTLTRADLGRLRPRASLYFNGCQFIDFTPNMVELTSRNKNVTTNNCAIRTLPKDAPSKLDLNDLFPDWKERLE